MIEVKSVNKFYGKNRVLNNISFEIQDGEIIGMLGRNGAGKTTTFRCIMNLIKPDYGFVKWNGKHIDSLSLKKIGYLPEQRSLMPKLSVYETILFFGRLKGVNRWKIRRRWKFWSKHLEIKKYKRMNIKQLSKGNQQKVQILVSLIHNPSFIILDEPFSGLDPVNRRILIKVLQLYIDKGSSILFSTHNIEEVERFCSKVVIINDGKILYYGKIIDLKEKYKRNTLYVETKNENNSLKRKINKYKKKNNVKVIDTNNETYVRVEFENLKDLNNFSKWAKNQNDLIKLINDLPSLNTIFIDLLKSENKDIKLQDFEEVDVGNSTEFNRMIDSEI